MHVAGLEVVPATVHAATSAASATSATPTSQPYAVSLKNLELSDLQYEFDDQFLSPPVQLKAAVDRFSIRPRANSQMMDIKGAISLPGIARGVRIDGAIDTTAGKQSVQVALNVQGIHPEIIRPYLAAEGIESELKDAQFVASMRVDQTGAVQRATSRRASVSRIFAYPTEPNY